MAKETKLLVGLRIPEGLKKRIDAIMKADGLTRTKAMLQLLDQGLLARNNGGVGVRPLTVKIPANGNGKSPSKSRGR